MISFIFDVDGTLIDSYDGIISALNNVLNNHNINIDNVRKHVIDTSVYEFLIYASTKCNLESNQLFEEYKIERIKTQYDYKFMNNAIDVLRYLYNKGYKLFIFTHKGNSINKILKDNNIDNLFLDVISSDHEFFKRKPEAYSIDYLVDKYGLDKNNTYYVGDRRIDIECSKNANVKSIYYYNGIDSNMNSNLMIKDFIELKKVF